MYADYDPETVIEQRVPARWSDDLTETAGWAEMNVKLSVPDVVSWAAARGFPPEQAKDAWVHYIIDSYAELEIRLAEDGVTVSGGSTVGPK